MEYIGWSMTFNSRINCGRDRKLRGAERLTEGLNHFPSAASLRFPIDSSSTRTWQPVPGIVAFAGAHSNLEASGFGMKKYDAEAELGA